MSQGHDFRQPSTEGNLLHRWVLREDIMADDLVQEYNAKHPLPVPTPRKKRKRDGP